MEVQIMDQLISIVEKEKKVTTYKFALLRAVVEIVTEEGGFVSKKGSKVEIPMGLVIERWLLYYYALVDTALDIPQINSANTNLAFYANLLAVVTYYQSNGGREQLERDLTKHCVPGRIATDVFKLCVAIDKTIRSNPVKRFGSSIVENRATTIFATTKSKWEEPAQLNKDWLVQNGGMLSMDMDYYQAFKTFGKEAKYMNNLLHHWALFSKDLNQTLTVEDILGVLR